MSSDYGNVWSGFFFFFLIWKNKISRSVHSVQVFLISTDVKIQFDEDGCGFSFCSTRYVLESWHGNGISLLYSHPYCSSYRGWKPKDTPVLIGFRENFSGQQGFAGDKTSHIAHVRDCVSKNYIKKKKCFY
jgi:hypothetical protein